MSWRSGWKGKVMGRELRGLDSAKSRDEKSLEPAISRTMCGVSLAAVLRPECKGARDKKDS